MKGGCTAGRFVSIPDRDSLALKGYAIAFYLILRCVSIPDRDSLALKEKPIERVTLNDVEFQSLIGIH